MKAEQQCQPCLALPRPQAGPLAVLSLRLLGKREWIRSRAPSAQRPEPLATESKTISRAVGEASTGLEPFHLHLRSRFAAAPHYCNNPPPSPLLAKTLLRLSYLTAPVPDRRLARHC